MSLVVIFFRLCDGFHDFKDNFFMKFKRFFKNFSSVLFAHFIPSLINHRSIVIFWRRMETQLEITVFSEIVMVSIASTAVFRKLKCFLNFVCIRSSLYNCMTHSALWHFSVTSVGNKQTCLDFSFDR